MASRRLIILIPSSQSLDAQSFRFAADLQSNLSQSWKNANKTKQKAYEDEVQHKKRRWCSLAATAFYSSTKETILIIMFGILCYGFDTSWLRTPHKIRPPMHAHNK